MSPSRAARREDLERRIVQTGRRHLVEHGAAGLSLRAVTRDLGMVSSAVYRYVSSRDELLTLLLVDAYTEVGDAVDAAIEGVPGSAWDDRVVAAGLAFRGWAAADPSSYALLYGSPVPGYAAPAERTVGPGTRVPLALARLVTDGLAAGDIDTTGTPAVTPARLRQDLGAVAEDLGMAGGPEVTARALTLWATLVGATSLEVFGQYGHGAFAAPAALLEHELRLAIGLLRG